MQKEPEVWEIDLEESTLGYIIIQLEQLNQLLNKQRIKDNRLTKAIQLLDELDNENDWEQFQKLWTTLGPELRQAMNSLPSVNFFEVVAPFYQAEILIDDFANPDGLLQHWESALENINFETSEELKATLEKVCRVFFIQEMNNLLPLSSDGILLEDFKKVLRASVEVDNFAEMEESQNILLNLFELIPLAVKQNNRQNLELIYRGLMHNEARMAITNLIEIDFNFQSADNKNN